MNMDINESIAQMNSNYNSYMRSLKAVLDFGEANVAPLVSSLNNKFASPVAKALGLMMYADAAVKDGIPVLLDWLAVQSPMYPDVFEALRRAGDLVEPELVKRLQKYLSTSDDEAVRNLLDLASRQSDQVVARLLPLIEAYAKSPNEHFREAAADAIWRIGLPVGKLIVTTVRQLAVDDPIDRVRRSASEALQRLEAPHLR